MKIPPGSNPALATMIFNQKMKAAQEMEAVLEAQRFTEDSDDVLVTVSGKPELIFLDVKRDVDAKVIITSINKALHQAHVYRDAQAKELIGS